MEQLLMHKHMFYLTLFLLCMGYFFGCTHSTTPTGDSFSISLAWPADEPPQIFFIVNLEHLPGSSERSPRLVTRLSKDSEDGSRAERIEVLQGEDGHQSQILKIDQLENTSQKSLILEIHSKTEVHLKVDPFEKGYLQREDGSRLPASTSIILPPGDYSFKLIQEEKG